MNIKNNNNTWCVYKHQNILNGKIYIGITCRIPQKRWGRNGCNYRQNKYFYNSIQKYGWDNFKHQIIKVNLSLKEAEEIEIKLISFYKSSQFKYGYNQDNGGCGKGRLTDEIKIKIGKSNKGKKRTKETKELMSKIASNMSQEHKDKISNAHKGKQPWNTGKILSEKEKDNMKQNTYKKVQCIELNITYKSIAFASRESGLQAANISNVCAGKRKTTGGYHWKFVE